MGCNNLEQLATRFGRNNFRILKAELRNAHRQYTNHASKPNGVATIVSGGTGFCVYVTDHDLAIMDGHEGVQFQKYIRTVTSWCICAYLVNQTAGYRRPTNDYLAKVAKNYE